MKDDQRKVKKGSSISLFISAVKKLLARIPKNDWTEKIDQDIKTLQSMQGQFYDSFASCSRVIV